MHHQITSFSLCSSSNLSLQVSASIPHLSPIKCLVFVSLFLSVVICVCFSATTKKKSVIMIGLQHKSHKKSIINKHIHTQTGMQFEYLFRQLETMCSQKSIAVVKAMRHRLGTIGGWGQNNWTTTCTHCTVLYSFQVF